MKMRFLLAAALALLLLVAAVGAGAFEPGAPRVAALGSNFRVSPSGADADDLNSKVVWNATSNEYLVIWQGDGRRVSAAGKPVEAAVSAPGSEGAHPGVAWNSVSNEYLVAWIQGGTVFGRRLSAAGAAMGADSALSEPAASPSHGELVVAWNATDEQYLVVWADERDAGTRGADIYGHRVSAAGVEIGSDFRISSPQALGDESEPAVVWNGTSNRYEVVWQDGRNIATRGLDIYGVRVSSAGVPANSDVRISGAGAVTDDRQPAVAWNDADNQYLVVWRDERNAGTRGFDIYGRRLAATGANLGGDFRVSANAAGGDEGEPSVVWNGTTGEYLVVHEDSRAISSRGWDVYARPVSAAGVPIGAGVRISPSTATSDEVTPGVAWNATSNQYLIVWEDMRDAATRGWDIYGRRATG